MPEIRTQRVALFLAALAVLGACTPGGGRDTRSITLYTSVTQDTVDAVVEAFVPPVMAGLLFYRLIETLLFAPVPVAASCSAASRCRSTIRYPRD